jgi:hypothetical protein
MSASASRPAGRVILVPFALLLLAAVGCAPATTDVSGTVKYQGKPVPAGSVTLVDSSGVVHQGDIGTDGRYSIPKVMVGSVRIAVSVPKSGLNKPPPFGGKPEDLPKLPPNLPEVPLELASPDTSGLTGTVTAGQPLDIDIPK